jgi:WD40 repeat protein
VAIGDEEGHIRLLESAKDGKPKFKDVFLSFRPHSNAVIDMSFSRDDSLLATASGDQTARVVDMTTQRTVSVLAQHSASLKQVKFQPGAANNSVIATSSRDGSVQIWDLRCKGTQGPVQDIHVSMDPSSLPTIYSQFSALNYGCIVNSIYDAHRPGLHARLQQSAVARDGPSRGELPGRVGDVSVTAITFLPEGQEHMLLTASEANASVKLWDVRCLHHTRRKTALPLSCTALPESHNQWRHFGINSLNLSGNGSRLYALCRDNTVYAYSTAHLILGQAPELSTNTMRRRHHQGDVREGLYPLYGLRHRQLHATSFYVKAAIRPAKADKAEMLAVGSCDGCTVLFPTDERYVEMGQKPLEPELTMPPRLRRSGSGASTYLRSNDSIPISENGTPLIRGHEKEVGALTWTSDGELVTVGDDFLVRCWRETRTARKLRMGGEDGGQRWGCGWADIPTQYDEDDKDEDE